MGIDAYAEASPLPPPRSRPLRKALRSLSALLIVYLVLAYVVLPLAWRRHASRHPALEDAPRITHTANGIPGDPLNIALVGSEEEVQKIMLAAQWHPADPITLASSLRIARRTLMHRAYEAAPVSSLFVWGRKQDLAFEQPVGHDPRQRHHVRFWRSEQVDEQSRPLWMGATTYDTKVGFSHTTGQITHHIGADVDAERDKLVEDLKRTGHLSEVYWRERFHEQLQGRNGGGDPYRTDGRLAVAVVALAQEPERE
jgi:hypothetical protein